MESIDEIKKFHNLRDRPFKRYVPYLYNYYQIKNKNIPSIPEFKKEKFLILEKDLLNKINEIYIKYSKSVDDNDVNETLIKELVIDDEKANNKYHYFNKSKNEYIKIFKYCQFEDCIKIGNFTVDKKDIVKKHSNDLSVNKNTKTVSKKCNYNNCKRNVIKTKYCQNHKFKCEDHVI